MTVTMATFVDALTTIKRCTLCEVADFCRKTIPKENRKFAHFNLQEILFPLANRAFVFKGRVELDDDGTIVF